MKRVAGHRIGVEQGDVLFSDYETGGAMWEGEGPRAARALVRFSEPFREPPAVQVALTMWDISNAANARADVTAEDVAREGFGILFRTWGDTRVARVRVGWTAIGSLRDDDDWDVA